MSTAKNLMTCIVGLVDKGNIYLGGDSAGVGGWEVTIRADPKVFRNGPFLAGYTSSFRMGQLLRYALVPPPFPPGGDIYRYMVIDFVNAVRVCLKDGGYARKESEQEAAGTWLVGFQGRLFHIDNDYQVGEPVDEYDAVGSGAEYARGSLHATQGYPPLVRVRMALEAAAYFNIGVRGPFVIEVLEPETTPPPVSPASPAVEEVVIEAPLATNGHHPIEAAKEA